MNSLKTLILSSAIFVFSRTAIAQNPEYVDPGNVRDRNQNDSVYLWDNPEVYIPLVIIVVLLIAFLWLRSRKKSRRKRP